jgi:hypothetical protein
MVGMWVVALWLEERPYMVGRRKREVKNATYRD